MRQAWLEFFGDYDLLLCPASPTTAFPHDHAGERWEREVVVDGKPRSVNEHLFWAGYSALFGLPSTVAPIGRSPAGLPIGVQIIGPPGGDRLCIRFAQLLERAYHRFEIPPAFA
jgi:amidase